MNPPLQGYPPEQKQPGAHKPERVAHATAFTQTSIFLDRFSANFDHQISLTNQVPRTGDDKIVFCFDCIYLSLLSLSYHGCTHIWGCASIFARKVLQNQMMLKINYFSKALLHGLSIGVAPSYGLLKQFNTLLKQYFTTS